MDTANVDRRKRTAIHEAGHTVARIRVGMLYIGITTIIPKDGMLGYSSGEESWGSEEAAKDEILISCSGYAAVVAAGYDNSKAEEGCYQDFENAEQIIEFWGLGTLEDWKAKAICIMHEPKNIRAVSVIANKLIERSTLDLDRADFLVDLADGEATEDEWLRFDRIAPIWGNIHRT